MFIQVVGAVFEILCSPSNGAPCTRLYVLSDFKKREILSSRCLYVRMLYVLCMSAKLIAFSLVSINLGHRERIIKIGQVVFKLYQKITNQFHYNTLYARAGKGRSIRRPKNRARQNINASSVPYSFLLALTRRVF